MKLLQFLSTAFLSVSLSSCSYQYVAQTTNSLATATEFKAHIHLHRMRDIGVSTDNVVCLAPLTVDDAEFKREFTKQSFTALQTYFVTTVGLVNVESQAGALRAAANQNCDLLFYPALINKDDKIWSVSEWGEPQTDWNDIGVDKLQMAFTVWDVNGAQLMDRAIVNSRTAWLDLYASNSIELISSSIDLYLQQLVVLR